MFKMFMPKRVSINSDNSSTSAKKNKSTTIMVNSPLKIGDGHPVDVKYLTGNMLEADVDVLVVSCNEDVQCAKTLFNCINKMAGPKFIKALEAARNLMPSGRVRPGEIIVINLAETNMKQKYIFMAVQPDKFHASMAYRNVFINAVELKCTTMAIPGLGCGAVGLSMEISSKKCADVFHDLLSNDRLNTLKSVVFIDMQYGVAAAFEESFSAKFGLTKSAPVMPFEMEPFRQYVAVPIEVQVKENCVVCFEELGEDPSAEIVQLVVCQHQFHAPCFKNLYESMGPKRCPTCKKFYAMPVGNMPVGAIMREHVVNDETPLEGGQGYITLNYSVPGGIQGPEHPRPGVAFQGTSRQAFLPNTDEGRQVLRLLRKAFECRLTFTVGDSITTGAQNVVVWNNIHHKTNLHGGSSRFGYPDADYLTRVTEELKSVGITEDIL